MEVIHPILGKFVVAASIGEGTFATVYTAHHPRLRQPVAIKVFNDEFPEESVYEAFQISSSIVHPLICQEYDIFKNKNGETCILMEYVNGMTLLDYANSFGPISPKEIQTFIGQLIMALDFIHKNNIIHRDLKCENILIDNNHNIRIIDFGFSTRDVVMHDTTCGSPSYLAPEIIAGKPYGTSIDIWSLGVVIYAITYGQLPFENQNLPKLFAMITKEEPSYETEDDISEDLIDLIKKMLIKDPESRITLDQIKQHPYFTKGEKGREYEFNSFVFNELLRDNFPNLQLVKQLQLPDDQYLRFMQDLQQGNKTIDTMLYQMMKKSYLSNVKLPELSKKFLVPVTDKRTRPKDTFQVITFSNRIVQHSLGAKSSVNIPNSMVTSSNNSPNTNADVKKASTVSFLNQYFSSVQSQLQTQSTDSKLDQSPIVYPRLVCANPFIKASARARRHSNVPKFKDLKASQPKLYAKEVTSRLPNLFSQMSS